MIQDDDKIVLTNTLDDAFLNEGILLAMGFKYKGTYNDTYNTRAYTYEKEHIGRLEVFIQDLKCYAFKNNLVPETDVVVVSSITHPINDNPNVNTRIDQRYMLRVRDLKELIEFRRLTAKIYNLQHQAEDMLRHGHLRTRRDLELDVSGYN